MMTVKQSDDLEGFWKCIDTINSCKTKSQLEIARRMCYLYSRQETNTTSMCSNLVTALLLKECILSTK